MRPLLSVLVLAAATLAFTAPGNAGAPREGYYGHYQQNCITKRIRTADAYGRIVTKRVRICQ
ncbi:hypothetical protein NN6n1_18340 [Shinella zoogloeoides]